MEACGLFTVQADNRFHIGNVGLRTDPGPHRLEGVGVLPAPEGPVGPLPIALADIVSYGVAEDALRHLVYSDVLHSLADYHDQFTFVVHARRVGRHDYILAMW